MMISRWASALAASTLAACASYSGVVPAGGDTFMISKQQATGFPGLGNMKAEVLTAANERCARDQRDMTLISETETKPPYILGNYPRVEIHFRCTLR